MLFKKAKKKNSLTCLAAAKCLQKELKKQVYVAHQRYVVDIATLVSKQPKCFWTYVKSQRKASLSPSFTHDISLSLILLR